MSEVEDKRARVAAIAAVLDGIDGHRIDIQRGCGFRWMCSCGDVGASVEVVKDALVLAATHLEAAKQ